MIRIPISIQEPIPATKGDPCPAMDLAALALDACKGYYKTNHCPSQDGCIENAFFYPGFNHERAGLDCVTLKSCLAISIWQHKPCTASNNSQS